MRTPLSLLLVPLAVAASVAACAGKAAERAAPSGEGSPVVYEIGVDGLSCPFCAYGIEKKLTSVEGVEHLEIRMDEGLVRVRMAAGATLREERARRIVKDAGFALRSFRRVGRPEEEGEE